MAVGNTARRPEASPVTWCVVALIVQKFGGTSVADAERMREVAEHVARTVRRGNQVVLVVSAMGKETDELLRLAGEVSAVQPGREMDMLVTAGERKAMALVCLALHNIGIDSESFTGSQAGFRTDANHRNAKILEVRPDRVTPTTGTPRSSRCGPIGSVPPWTREGFPWWEGLKGSRRTTT